MFEMALLTPEGVRRKVAELLVTHGDVPFAVVAHEIVEWANGLDSEAVQNAVARKQKPVMCAFNRIMNHDDVVRDWWPVDGVNRNRPEQNAKDWLARHKHQYTRIETKSDVIAEGDHEWFHGKSSGYPPKPRSGAWG